MKLRAIILLWLSWVIIMLGFQEVIKSRLGPQGVDYATFWTQYSTGPQADQGNEFEKQAVMKNQVAWDSSIYLGIAVYGYGRNDVQTIKPKGDEYHVSYAFFPLYPILIRYISIPFLLFGLGKIAAASLAGVLISVMGTLFGMIGLYHLTKDSLGEDGGLRTVFYLLVFPSSFFFAQVYTEGLFIGLAFGSLALLKYKKLAWASLLAGLAVLARPIGVALAVPILIDLIKDLNLKDSGFKKVIWPKLFSLIWVLVPIAVFLLWKLSFYGKMFDALESGYFHRSLFNFKDSFNEWVKARQVIFTGANLMGRAYYIMELVSVLLGLVSCFALIKKHTGLALFGLLLIIVPLSSVSAQGMIRYILPVPTVYILLSALGKNKVFDKAWTMAGILLLGMQTMLFTFGKWVG